MVSPSAMKAMRSAIRELNIRHQTQRSLDDIARLLNPLLRGWIEYYGRYAPSALYPLLRYVNQTPGGMRKFKRFKAARSERVSFFNDSARKRAGSLRTLESGISV